jgi:hypothetical protein
VARPQLSQQGNESARVAELTRRFKRRSRTYEACALPTELRQHTDSDHSRRAEDAWGATTSRMILCPLAGSCFGMGDRLTACSAADPLHLRHRHVESRPHSKPEQYIRRGDGARHLRRSQRHDPTRLPQGEILRETTRLALGAWPPPFLYSPIYAVMNGPSSHGHTVPWW